MFRILLLSLGCSVLLPAQSGSEWPMCPVLATLTADTKWTELDGHTRQASRRAQDRYKGPSREQRMLNSW